MCTVVFNHLSFRVLLTHRMGNFYCNLLANYVVRLYSVIFMFSHISEHVQVLNGFVYFIRVPAFLLHLTDKNEKKFAKVSVSEDLQKAQSGINSQSENSSLSEVLLY